MQRRLKRKRLPFLSVLQVPRAKQRHSQGGGSWRVFPVSPIGGFLLCMREALRWGTHSSFHSSKSNFPGQRSASWQAKRGAFCPFFCVSCCSAASHGLQQARLPCPSLCPEVCSSSCPSESVMPANHVILSVSMSYVCVGGTTSRVVPWL